MQHVWLYTDLLQALKEEPLSSVFSTEGDFNFCIHSSPLRETNKKSKHSDDSHSSAKIMLVSKIHTSHTKHTVLELFDMCSNHAPLNYSGQESKNNLQFIILTHLWPWNRVKIINPGVNCWTPCKVMLVNHGPSQQSSKEEYKPWKWGATARYYTSHTKTMLPTRKSVPRSSRQLDHMKISWRS